MTATLPVCTESLQKPNRAVVREALGCIKAAEQSQEDLVAIVKDVARLLSGTQDGLVLLEEWARPSVAALDLVRVHWLEDRESVCLDQDAGRFLAAHACLGGWQGNRDHLFARAALPLPSPTLPLATREDQLASIAHQGASMSPGCGKSVAFSGPPGLGKTTARAHYELQWLKDNPQGVVIHARQTRDLVRELQDNPRIGLGSDGAAGIQVLTSMGRGSDPLKDFYCSIAASRVGKSRREMGLPVCTKKGGHDLVCKYLQGKQQVRTALQGPGPLFVAATVHSLESLLKEVEGSGRSELLITIDDPDLSFGLFGEWSVRRKLLSSYRESVREWVQRTQDLASFHDPAIELAKVVISAVEVLLQAKLGHGSFAEWAESLSGLAQLCIQEWGQKAFAVPFDPKKGDQPAFGAKILGLALLCIEGFRAAVRRDGDLVVVAEPRRRLIAAARRGQVTFLTVGIMPEFVAKELGVQREIASWKIANKVVRVSGPDAKTKWRGAGGDKEPNKADLILRAWLEVILQLIPGKMGYLGTKADRDALQHLFSQHPEHVLGHYGKDHAGTNNFEKVNDLVVRRYRPQPQAVAWTAAALRGCLGLAISAGESAGCFERRLCPTTGKAFLLKVPGDPDQREVYRAWEGQYMLNAVGRCRPLRNPDCRIVLLDADPIEGLDCTSELGLAGLWPELSEASVDAILKDRRSSKLVKRDEAVWRCAQANPGADTRELVDLLDASGVCESPRAVRDSLRRMRAARSASFDSLATFPNSMPAQEEGEAGHPQGSGSLRSMAQVSPQALLAFLRSPGVIPRGPGLSARLAGMTGLSGRTVDRVLRGVSSGSLPARTDAQRNYLAVVRAMVGLAGDLGWSGP